MNLRQMEVFRAVMLTGGVGGAAQLLHVSQPAISKVLAQAQRSVSFPLFERVKGRLVATPEGQALYTEVETLWRGVEHVRDVSRNLAEPQAGTLRLAVSASLATHIVPRAVAMLYDRFSSLKSRMEILIAPIMVDSLLDRSADIGVAMQPIDHPNLVRVQTYRCGFACVMRADHRLSARNSLGPSDLAGERVITSPQDSTYGQALHVAYGAQARTLRLDMEVRSSTSACWLAQSGCGIAVVDQVAVAGQTFSGLVVRPFRTRQRLSVAIVRNRYRPLSVIQQAFCQAFERAWAQSLGNPRPGSPQHAQQRQHAESGAGKEGE